MDDPDMGEDEPKEDESSGDDGANHDVPPAFDPAVR